MINGNRQLNELKINRIIREINEGNDMLRYYPIQVKENGDRLDIIDGQHRFYICKKMKRPVYYILVSETKSLPDIAKVNSNVEKWKNSDFINCYVQIGNNNYQILQDFIDKYGFNITLSINMLSRGNPVDGGPMKRDNSPFEHGYFEVKYFDQAVEIAELAMLFKDFSNWRSRPFVVAIYRIHKAGIISVKEVLSAYKKRPEMLTGNSDYKSYIYNLEQIVNVGKKARIVLV